MRSLAVIVLFLLASACPAFAQTSDKTENRDLKGRYLYEWTNGEGGVHITDDLGEVPERYRSKVRKIEMPQGREVGGGQASGSPSGVATEEQEAAAKAMWQNRLREWKQQRADAEKQYQKLEQERTSLLGVRGSAALAPIENRQKAEQLQQQMEKVQQEINEARDMVEKVIPEEARRAGVPPGWLRE